MNEEPLLQDGAGPQDPSGHIGRRRRRDRLGSAGTPRGPLLAPAQLRRVASAAARDPSIQPITIPNSSTAGMNTK